MRVFTEKSWEHTSMTEKKLKFDYELGKRDFSQLHLPQAKLHKARLMDVNLSNAYLNRTVLSKADLSGAKFCRTIMPDGSVRNDRC